MEDSQCDDVAEREHRWGSQQKDGQVKEDVDNIQTPKRR